MLLGASAFVVGKACDGAGIECVLPSCRGRVGFAFGSAKPGLKVAVVVVPRLHALCDLGEGGQGCIPCGDTITEVRDRSTILATLCN